MSLNNEFFYILTVLSENVSIEKLNAQSLTDELISLISQISAQKYLLPSQDFIQILSQKIICHFCNTDIIRHISKCGHSFCEKCLNSITTELPLESQFSCPLCESPLSFLKPTANFKQCTYCDFYLHKMCYFEEPLCHDHCKTCIRLLQNNGKNKCVFIDCEKKLELDYNRVYSCGLCAKKLSLVSLHYLCKAHEYCYDCYKKGLAVEKCFKCEKKIDSEVYQRSKYFLKSSCGYCKQTKEGNLFVTKKCCLYRICIKCQSDYRPDKCRQCLNEINLLDVDS